MQLSNKQMRFVDEYLIDLNGAQAAIRSGFSKRSARQIATRLLSKADIRVLIQKKQKESEKRLQITRDEVILGLVRAVEEAREAGSPQGQINAWREIGRMMGYYDQLVSPAPQDFSEEQMRGMSDAELKALICRSQDGAGCSQ